MAQRDTSAKRKIKLLLRRFGLTTPKAGALALVVLLVTCAVLGLVRTLEVPTLTVERTQQADTAPKDGMSQDEAGAVEDNTSGEPSEDAQQQAQTLVHVDGAVANPGVYALTSSSPRVNDAIVLAGGLLPEADTTSLNLAAPLADGQKVHVPIQGEEPASQGEDLSAAQADSTVASASASSDAIDINHASEEELQQLPGIGTATAAAIVKDREANGPFLSCEDIMRVSGIGQKKYEKIQDKIRVS